MQATPHLQEMTITKLSEHIGAEVRGIDLRQPIDAATCDRLNAALVDNIVLAIRDQKFTPEEYLAAAAAVFGEPMEQDNPQMAVPGVPLLCRISNHDKSKPGEPHSNNGRWHTDHTNREYPPKFTALYAIALPDSGGATSVVNMRAGYRSLPAELRLRIDGMKTANVRLGSAVKKNFNATAAEAQKRLNPVPIIQPLVRTHPDNGTKALYFHANKTENILGMSPEDSQALLDELLDKAVRPEFVYHHRWRLGDMLIWDNRASMHKANYDFDPNDPTQNRLMYRILVKGERPR
jgi:taurine dioxygenase